MTALYTPFLFQQIETEEKGKGIISLTTFSAGEVMSSFIGEEVTDIRQHTLQIKPGLHLYDPKFIGLFWHSCEPNSVLDMQNKQIIALRNIFPNEPITIDYAHTEDVLFKQFDCSCGSPRCRGRVKGRLE